MASEIPGGDPAAPAGKDRQREWFVVAEQAAFQVLGRRTLSVRAAGEAVRALEAGHAFGIEEAALAAAVREAERGKLAEGAPPSGLTGRGGLVEEAGIPVVRKALGALDPHTRALLFAHFGLGLPPARTAVVVGMEEDSVGLNVSSALGRLRLLAGGASRPAGCGAPAAESVERRAAGIDVPGDAESAEAHLASGCAVCKALHEALAAERDALRQALRPLLEADPNSDTALSALMALEEPAEGTWNLRGALPVSRGSCMVLALLAGLLGACGVILLTDYEYLRDAFWPGGPEGERAAPDGGPPPPPLPEGVPGPRPTFEEALRSIGSTDPAKHQEAWKVLMENGKARLDDLLEAQRRDARLKEPLAKLFLDLGHAENNRQEQEALVALTRVRDEAAAEAEKEAAGARERLKGLDESIAKMRARVEELTAKGAAESEIGPWRLRLKDLEGRRAEVQRGAGGAEAASRIEKRLKDEIKARLKRFSARRQIMNSRAGILLLQGRKPAFPAGPALRFQGEVPVPPIPGNRALEEVIAHVARFVDFPIVLDPQAVKKNRTPAMSFPGEPLPAEALILEVCNVAGLKPTLFQGALLLAKPDRKPPDLLFAHLARFLRDPDPRARFAAAWGFEALTWKSFGFDPFASADSPGNRAAAEWMIEWLQKKGATITRDPETDRWGVPGEEWED